LIRRRLSQAARALALIAGLLGLLLVVLHSTPVVSWARRTLLERMSVLGDVSIGNLEYRLWRGEVLVQSIRIEPREEHLLMSVEVSEIRGSWVPFLRLDVAAIHPVVHLRASPESAEPAADEDVEPEVPSWLSRLRVEDGELYFRGEDNAIQLSMAPIDLTLTSDVAAGGARATVQAGGGTLAMGARSVQIRRVDAEAVAARDDLELVSTAIETEAGDARARGTIDKLSPFEGNFDLDFDLDAGSAGPLLLESGAERLGGEVRGSAALRFEGGAFSSDGEIEGRGLVVRDLAPFDGEARWDLRDELLRWNGLLQQGDLRLEMESALDLARNEQAFTAEVRAPSLNAALAAVGGPRSPWDTGIAATLSGRLAEFRPETLDGSGVIRFSGGEIEGVIDVDAKPGRIVAESQDLRLPGGRAGARARLNDFETVSAEYYLALNDLVPVLSPLVPAAKDWLSGELHVSGRTAGRVADLSSLASSLRVESEDFRLSGLPFVLYARADQRGPRVEIGRLSLAAAENGSTGSASLSGEIDLRRREVDLLGSLDTFPVHYLTPAEGLSGLATGSFAAEGSLDRPQGTASIELSPLGYSDLHLPSLGVELRSDGEEATLQATRLDSEAIVASARVALGGEYPLTGEVDLDVLPWEEISSRLPSSASLAVSGTARVAAPLKTHSLAAADIAVEKASVSIRDRSISTSSFALGVPRSRISGFSSRTRRSPSTARWIWNGKPARGSPSRVRSLLR
jgi:hypothetical protein